MMSIVCVLLHNLKAGFVRAALRYYALAYAGLFELYNMCSLAELLRYFRY